jgi:hypothetical protein
MVIWKFFNKRKGQFIPIWRQKGLVLASWPISDGQVDTPLPFFGLDMVRVSAHFDVDFPQWNMG